MKYCLNGCRQLVIITSKFGYVILFYFQSSQVLKNLQSYLTEEEIRMSRSDANCKIIIFEKYISIFHFFSIS